MPLHKHDSKKKEIECVEVRLKSSLQREFPSHALQKNFSKSLGVAPRGIVNASAAGVPQNSGTIILGKVSPSCLCGPVLSKCEAAPSWLYCNRHVLLTLALQSHYCRLPGLENVSFWPNWGISCHFKSLPCHMGQKPDERHSLFTQPLLAGGRALGPHSALSQNVFLLLIAIQFPNSMETIENVEQCVLGNTCKTIFF